MKRAYIEARYSRAYRVTSDELVAMRAMVIDLGERVRTAWTSRALVHGRRVKLTPLCLGARTNVEFCFSQNESVSLATVIARQHCRAGGLETDIAGMRLNPSASNAAIGVLGSILVLAIACNNRVPRQERANSNSSTPIKAMKSAEEHELRDGDIIFQESTSSQSDMVRALTRSRWTHMGVIFKASNHTFVLEAVNPVRKTLLQTWVSHGRERRYAVKRLRQAESKLTADTVARMQKLGATWLGRPYDLRFQWNDESLYCSELVFKLFDRGAGIRLGKLERAGDLNLNNPLVQTALKKRFAGGGFDPTETVVTPDSIFNDDQLVDVEL